MKGEDLVNILVSATGLPENVMKKEVSQLISQSGKTEGQLSLEDLREIMVKYLQIELLKAKKEFY